MDLIRQSAVHAPADAGTMATIPEHCLPLPEEGWAIWRLAALRGAGFPAAHVLRLSSTGGLRAAVDDLLQCEAAERHASRQALDSIRRALDDLRRNNLWDDRARRAPLLRALTSLRKGSMARLPAGVLEMECVQALIAAHERLDAARRRFQNQYDDARNRASDVIAEFAGCSRFREAVLWQNRQAVHSALDPLTEKRRRKSSRQKQHEELVAGYLQRYSVKNDTIGFFGPVGWATFRDRGEALVSKPGPDLLAARTVYFECWPIEALAAAILRNPAVYPWVAPLRMPFIHIEGLSVRHPVQGLLRLTPQEAAVASACDGNLLANEIAARLVARGQGFSREMQVYNTIKSLTTKGLLYWGFNLPVGPNPEKDLREALEKIQAPEVRLKTMNALRQLELARAAVACGAGDDRKLDAAMASLEQTFVQLTGVQPTRRPGETYSARTLVYEDCRRDIEVSLGPQLLGNLAPLSLVLLSARWLTAKCAEIYSERIAILYRKLADEMGAQPVGAVHLLARAMADIFKESDSQGVELQDQLCGKWQRAMDLDDAACQSSRLLRYSAEDLRPKVLAEFACPCAGWNEARYHSPDLMIAASSAEAVRRGEYTLVLGELHAGGNTLSASLFVNQHPSPEDMAAMTARDLEGRNIVPVLDKDLPISIGRLASALIAPGDFRLEYSRNSFAKDRSKALPIGSLVIEVRDGELVARARDGGFQCKVMELLASHLTGIMLGAFQMFRPGSHMPRIAIDNLVIKRESWRFKVEEIPLVACQEASGRFLEMRRWVKMLGLPRFLFFKVPVETKPCYLDAESPIYIELFAKALRRTLEKCGPAGTIDLSEMLPTPDQLWLSDIHGNRYTSELRMVALDLALPGSQPAGF